MGSEAASLAASGGSDAAAGAYSSRHSGPRLGPFVVTGSDCDDSSVAADSSVSAGCFASCSLLLLGLRSAQQARRPYSDFNLCG